MTVHRRSLECGDPTSAPDGPAADPDPFAVRVAGRHLYDRATHAYVRLAEPSWLAQLALAHQQVYSAPAVPVARTVLTAVEARAALPADFAAAVESAFGIDVIRLDDVDGDFGFETCGRSAIVVGTTSNWFFQDWSIAHELGHLLRGDLGEVPPAGGARVSERGANAFASELLLPASVVSSRDWLEPQEADVADFVWDSGVSTRALASRLRSLKLETSPGVRALLAQPTGRLVRRSNILNRNPLALDRRIEACATPRLPPDLVDAHLSAVADGRGGSESLEWLFARSR